MNVSTLKTNVNATGSYFFDRKTMEHFGDTMKNYYVPVATVKIKCGDKLHNCYELQRKQPVINGLEDSVFFDSTTFELIHGKLV